MSTPGRPLSPHLSIYRWPITMALSILHRLSGISLSVGLVAYAAWLVAASSSDADYGRYVDFMSSWVGQVMLIGWSAAFFFHFANGVRHLAWDLGYGFELPTANGSAWFVVVLTVVLTATFWVLV